MWSMAWTRWESLLLGGYLVHAAVDLDGVQVVHPVTSEDPSPIADPNSYQPDQYNCPLPCIDYSNVHKWTPYFSVDRLRWCKEPMLLQFSVTHPLDDPETTILIRSCTLGASSSTTETTIANTSSLQIDNPKNADYLFEKSLDVAPSCAFEGTKVESKLAFSTSSGGGIGDSSEVDDILTGIQDFFNAKDNCDETFLFAYHKQTVASVYIGPGLGKPTVASAVEALGDLLHAGGPVANRTIAQACSEGSKSESIFGISIDAVQRTSLNWSQGKCAVDDDLVLAEDNPNISLYDIAGTFAASNGTININNSTSKNTTSKRGEIRPGRNNALDPRATCRYIQVVSGDGCASLVSKCGISVADFTKYNPKPDLCSTLQPGDYVCCSTGDPYTPPKPTPPSPNADGTCASYIIKNGDSCGALAEKYGLTVDDIEGFNKGKTWAWTECKNMLIDYNMCLSEGTAPLPPPQEGAECGPLVPGTEQPTDPSVSMVDLNPCPLKACCSNWGFCGPFPQHCDIHAPEGGGPGAKLPDFENTCISNCGNEIKQNSGPPAVFQRIGYFESWNQDRDCLWLKAENANTDGSYTHMHWGFAEIDPESWKPVLKDPHDQWDAFKKLENMKRIVSFGGWAYSTEAATYNIIRSAIIDNYETFATNLAQFVSDESIDGIDIDWEYPGAPDILVDGQPIGQKGDGAAYLRFLTTLKDKLGDKSVSIAAPASYWYLKAFPIDQIAAVIDYIVYMTYDLHGQWDYGNVNAFDSCPSGKCIRSRVNLTETRNSLSIITKAGVPNNKIFVGEASYGRSFHMAVDGCWGPTCDFTGSRTQSDAQPGRCTKEGGYIANAEIDELIRAGSVQQLHDADSNTDVLLYNGDYISYMTPVTKNTRREDWKDLNFAGSIDWAVDLQAFGADDLNAAPDRPETGEEGCISGEDKTVNTGDLCEFACNYGFCPESLCACNIQGPVVQLPSEVAGDIIAWDELDVDLNRLCKFACKHGYCPPDICTTPVVDSDQDGIVEVGPDPDNPNWYDTEAARRANLENCMIFQDPKYRDASVEQCRPFCASALEEAKEADRTSNYGCVGVFPLDKPIPWTKEPGTSFTYAPAKCSCDNYLVNFLADTIIEALPIIAEIGCYLLMSSLKTVLDIGLDFIPGAGKALDAGLDMVTTAAQVAAYAYPEEEDPEGAFSWWLSPCGNTDLVPDDIKEAFDILSTVADGVSSFKTPNFRKGSGKKGDTANPIDRSKPKPGTGKGPSGTGNGVTKTNKCRVPASSSTLRLGQAKNTLREQSCVSDKTTKTEMIVTSIAYGAQQTQVAKTCSQSWSQACFHYSSAISRNPTWATLTCPPAAGATSYDRPRPAVRTWYSAQHQGAGWQDRTNRKQAACDADEYPPAYLLDDSSPAYINSGKNAQGQSIRYLPDGENRGAGSMWKGACFAPHVKELSDGQVRSGVSGAAASSKKVARGNGFEKTFAEIDVSVKPEFTISEWGQQGRAPPDDGLSLNTCWPEGIAAGDPGFALLSFDLWYNGKPHPYDYTKDYVKGSNGS
ncbi:glycoside hydrolase family 18 protein [Hypoxylon rubiginosum]|uniref:Glycoside hydrolase family 18 protein n=1 Tax=Hypoxylon rubiginosum TaxID=110542 RepID=A0ACC0D069_9PEZI|nr:glycoside hydrolase family 18 protein [Hypoxylon rubiginosum]